MLVKFQKHPHLSERELVEPFKIPRNTLTRLINKEEELGETSHTQPPVLLYTTGIQ